MHGFSDVLASSYWDQWRSACQTKKQLIVFSDEYMNTSLKNLSLYWKLCYQRIGPQLTNIFITLEKDFVEMKLNSTPALNEIFLVFLKYCPFH